jgi:hypothetical protein
MPKIDTVKLKFKKKNYRPWNLLDDDMDIKTALIQKEKAPKFVAELTKNESNEFKNEPEVEENLKNFEFKKEKNLEQTGNKRGTNGGHNLEQTGNKRGTNGEQIGNKQGTNGEQTGNKRGSQPGTNQGTNEEQTGNKQGTKETYLSLSGLQQILMIFLFKHCANIGQKSTQKLSIAHISKNLNLNFGSVKTTLKRLVKKNLIIPSGSKCGRGGWVRFDIPQDVYFEMASDETGNKRGTNEEQTGNKQGSQPGSQPGTKPPYSSSSYYINKTTTTNEAIKSKKNGIDISALLEIGFGEIHLQQLLNHSGLPEEIIQDSIDAFAFDLQRNNMNEKIRAKKTTPLRYFMGTVVKGIPYSPPDNYETPKQEAMRKYLEIKKTTKENEKKMTEEIIEIALNEWKNKPENRQTIEKIIADLPTASRANVFIENAIHAYFVEKIWPLEKPNFIN